VVAVVLEALVGEAEAVVVPAAAGKLVGRK